ncbi:hypothetical protein [Roseimarinus sediminis]|uniref:hypothetical protein n=1 Tax=Roseimarinus sediminis TaxID=1610899 RepID=UPI003D1C1D1D
MNYSYEEYNLMVDKNDGKVSKLVKVVYALVLFIAASFILLLFEDVVKLNIYLVYLVAGIILGLSVIIFLDIFSKRNQ